MLSFSTVVSEASWAVILVDLLISLPTEVSAASALLCFSLASLEAFLAGYFTGCGAFLATSGTGTDFLYFWKVALFAGGFDGTVFFPYPS